jgi:hypothetical protein
VGLSVVIIPAAYRFRMVAAVKVAAIVFRPVHSEHVFERGRIADIFMDVIGFLNVLEANNIVY